MSVELGKWFKVTSGPHRGRSGVVDLIEERPNGTFYRVTNPSMIVGRFQAEQLEPIASPLGDYRSQIEPEVYQRALDMLTGGRVKA